MKERKRLAKRIIKAIQPQLEAAARAEADITSKPTDQLLKEVEQLLEYSLESRELVSLGQPSSVGDADAEHEQDVDMVDASHASTNGIENNNGDTGSELTADLETAGATDSIDVDMQDLDAPGEEIDEADEFAAVPSGPSETGDTINTGINTSTLSELNGNVSPSKTNHAHGLKNTHTPPDTNGYVSAPEKEQPTPPTPPVSNGGSSVENIETLTQGGVPWYMKDFEPEGTSIREAVSTLREDVSDADEDELRGLGGVGEGDGEVVSTIAVSSPSKTKKGKAKKKAKGSKK
jgi:NuA3 HAT complex component NTO1